jgi:hypothetical protein
MSTNYQYAPVFPQGTDLISESYPSRVLPLRQIEPDRVQQNLDDGRKAHKENSYRTAATRDAGTGNILEIPNWPSPQTLEKTRMESTLISVGYILCLVPPLFFLCKGIMRTTKPLNRANIHFCSASTICHRSTFKGGKHVRKSSPSSLSSGEFLLS